MLETNLLIWVPLWKDRNTIVNDGGSHADYKEIRKEAYLRTLGDWGDQLDMIYKDLVNGTFTTSGTWATHIKDVKDTHPKPS